MGLRRRTVSIKVSENYYSQLQQRKQDYAKKMGLDNITTTSFTDIIARSKMQFPKIKMRFFQNAKKKFIKRI